MKKRSLSIAGHATSISIEEPFWQALREIATARSISVAALAAEIDGARTPETNLSSAIRLHVLAWYQARETRPAPVLPDGPGPDLTG
ncbi:ribbon-helix-helix domain-containing protein [Kaistia dalseonensis]|uniref:DNA-binding ribbon-helix-helix protein n=1 Tax=Kaistia dalseonensis TaxID=410840 RepID=A0ABU0HD20_9HYPH|nr:ribbon-helix-helix domain-containing protein [Kaistia dalseonensis]MCX5497112.1 ribbon-helix-helix domain-containing protein [Kaistia dalseonensis]MDQ0439738.1 putative DNA-binding ribbon-helix-helix protein [Kaistia dalseonensis]